MQNPTPKFRQSSIISEKPGYLSENWKLQQAPTAIKFNIFCWNFAHVAYLTMCTKGFLGLFLFCLDLKLLKNVKKECAETSPF